MIRPLATIVLLLSAGAVASGQDALGGGRVLDRNLQVGGTGVNPARLDFASELRFRNAVVTGNAPGGLSFRGDVGYRAPGEFFNSLPSDALFAFRRDSVYSGLGGLGLRGTDALQYQFALTTGNRPPPSLTGTGVVQRQAAGATGSLLEQPAGAGPVTVRAPGTPGADDRGGLLWQMRSPAAYVAAKAIEPALVGVMVSDRGQRLGVTASPLRGLSTTALPEPREGSIPMSSEALQRRDMAAPTGPMLEGPKAGAPAEREAARALTPYQEILDRLEHATRDPAGARWPGGVAPATAPDTGAVPEWRRRLDEIRKMLDEGAKAAEPRRLDEEGERRPPVLDPATVQMLRGLGEPLQLLAPEGFDAYARHMRIGEEYLSEGRFFQAEERFTAALSMRPGDTMASVGRIHAQLGNSLFLSAAVNLRRLLMEHPEMIGVRYDEELLPSVERMEAAKVLLDRLIADVAAGMQRDAGLLLAYLGYQGGDEGAVDRGLTAIESAQGAEDDQLARLGALLRRVWVGAPARELRGPPAGTPVRPRLR